MPYVVVMKIKKKYKIYKLFNSYPEAKELSDKIKGTEIIDGNQLRKLVKKDLIYYELYDDED